LSNRLTPPETFVFVSDVIADVRKNYTGLCRRQAFLEYTFAGKRVAAIKYSSNIARAQ
jgi:hypothetical protein